MKNQRIMPLSSVVREIQDNCRSEAEAIATLTAMLGCQRVVFRRNVRSLIEAAY